MPFDANGHSYPGRPPDHMAILLGHVVSQSRTLGRIETRLEHGDEFHKEVRSDLIEIKGRLRIVEKRKPTSVAIQILVAARAFALAVAPVKEWIWGAVFIVLMLRGYVSAAEIKAWVLSGALPK